MTGILHAKAVTQGETDTKSAQKVDHVEGNYLAAPELTTFMS